MRGGGGEGVRVIHTHPLLITALYLPLVIAQMDIVCNLGESVSIINRDIELQMKPKNTSVTKNALIMSHF